MLRTERTRAAPPSASAACATTARAGPLPTARGGACAAATGAPSGHSSPMSVNSIQSEIENLITSLPLFSRASLLDFTRLWIPFRSIVLHLELLAGDERVVKIFRIVHDAREDQITFAFEFYAVKVFGQNCIGAVRHAIFAKITGPHVCRHNFQRPSLAGRRPAKRRSEATTLHLAHPGSHRITLPLGRTARRGEGAEMEHSLLPARIGFHLQSHLIRPRNVQTSGEPHQPGGAVRFALIAV